MKHEWHDTIPGLPAPVRRGCDGIKFDGTQAYPGFLGETWGGSSSNIEGDIPIIEGADELGGIKFDWCLRGGTGEGIWPSGGGGRNIDPTDTVEFGGSDFVWPPGDTSPGPSIDPTDI